MLIQSLVSLPPSPYEFFSILPTKYDVRMANGTDSSKKDNLDKFSNDRVESIKEIVLQSIIQILPQIINGITPAIIKSTGDIIKATLNENSLPTD